MKKRLMAVDLDGTLITGNSLHEYIRCGLRHSSIWVRVCLVALLAARRLRLISHLAMKRRVLALIKPDDEFKADLTSRVRCMVRHSVMEEIERHQAGGGTVLLATAAPETYVPLIWSGDYVCSDRRSEVECRGEEKLRRVLRFADDTGVRLSVVITDHPDDMPLLSYPGVARILAGETHAARFASLGVDFDRRLL